MTVQVGQGGGNPPTGTNANGGIGNALFYSGGRGEVVPTKRGWHLLTFTNGDTAVVYYGLKGWQWNGLNPPNGDVTSLNWLASSDSDATKWNWTVAFDAIDRLFSHADAQYIQRQIIAQIDHGQLQGTADNPIIVSKTGAPTGGTPAPSKGDATGSNINPPNLPSFGLTGLEGDAIRVLEAVGAVLLLAIGLRALIAGDNPTSITMAAARKVAKVAR